MDFSTFLIAFIIMAFIPIITFIARKDKRKVDSSRYTSKKKEPFSHSPRPKSTSKVFKEKKTFSLPLSLKNSLNRLLSKRNKKKTSFFPSLKFKKNLNDLLSKLELESHAFNAIPMKNRQQYRRGNG